MKFYILVTLSFFLILAGLLMTIQPQSKKAKYNWQLRSVDTVKYSRDLAREKLNDPGFDSVIEKQVSDIASMGTTHIALGTPYDAEFIPYLKRWVEISRKHRLKVWFRGNFAGWEGWFGYPDINRATHTKMVEKFILENPDLFANGDIFTPCTECENGNVGDPRKTRDIVGHRQFLIDEYKVSSSAFEKIGRKVSSGYYSMNFDVAKTIMDYQTTSGVGGIVVIDHYVADPLKLGKDAKQIAQQSGGKVVIGEFGVPIPDINGQMDDDQQASWIATALENLTNTSEVIGVNYWVSVGGSTEIWDKDGKERKAVNVIRQYFIPKN